jgi:hypothetical protein
VSSAELESKQDESTVCHNDDEIISRHNVQRELTHSSHRAESALEAPKEQLADRP